MIKERHGSYTLDKVLKSIGVNDGGMGIIAGMGWHRCILYKMDEMPEGPEAQGELLLTNSLSTGCETIKVPLPRILPRELIGHTGTPSPK